MDWRPSAGLAQLRARASLLHQLRRFFAERDIMEVETPLLCSNGVTDPSLEPFVVERGRSLVAPRYLQTSPEYAMKRLLAAGSGPIFQIARAFRDGEAGRRHNPEFTLLEWYRPGFDHHQLMGEVAELVCLCLGARRVRKRSYRECFNEVLGVDPLTAPARELESLARAHCDPGTMSGDRDLWLDLLMSHVIEPGLSGPDLHFIYDYPASQAALARIEQSGESPVGRRFELFVEGVELANGYFELLDPQQQRQRFLGDNARRREHGLAQRPLDEYLLAAMASGLPSCSGVALGVDRLLMLQAGVAEISDTLAFSWERC